MRAAIPVRRLTAADGEAFRAIRLDALKTEPDSFGSTYAVETAWPAAAFAARLETSFVFGADAGAGLLGIVGLQRDPPGKAAHKALLWGLYVRPAARGAGVAAALTEAALQAADGIVEQVRLQVVAGNEAALALYVSFGFVAYGVEPRALKGASGYVDEVLMVRFAGAPRVRRAPTDSPSG